MRNGWVFSTRLAAVFAATMFGMGATSTEFSVGVTVIAPCSIGIGSALKQTSMVEPKAALASDAPIRLSCADGTRPAVSRESLPPPEATQTVSSAPGITRVTISY